MKRQQGQRALVIDRDDAERRRLANELGVLGWVVEQAANVRIAIDAAISHQPGLILTELSPPYARGYHFVRTLRSVIEQDLVIIGMTADVGRNHDREIDAGFDHVLPRPVVGERAHGLVKRRPRS